MGRRARDALRTLGECDLKIGFLLFETAEISVSFGYVLGSASKSRTPPLSPRRARGLFVLDARRERNIERGLACAGRAASFVSRRGAHLGAAFGRGAMSSWPSVHVSVFEQGPEVTAVTNDPNPSSAYLRPVQAVVAEAMRKVLAERPADPIEAIGNFLIERADELDREAGSEEAAQKAAEAAKKAREAARKAALAKMPPDERAYAEAVDYVFENADYTGSAKRYANPQENWERFETLLAELQQPYEKLQVVHIAGTNGKGTTSALCDVMLRASTSGSVGLFTSPHLHCFRERIRVDGALVSKSAIVEALKVVKPAVAKLPDGYASPFEKLTALALVCFTTAGCKWAVMETGLGGRWDCTNHCAEPLVCGITKIGFDHMNVSARRAPPLTRRLPPRAARRPGSALPRSPVAACQSHLSSCRPLTRSSHSTTVARRTPISLRSASNLAGAGQHDRRDRQGEGGDY